MFLGESIILTYNGAVCDVWLFVSGGIPKAIDIIAAAHFLPMFKLVLILAQWVVSTRPKVGGYCVRVFSYIMFP